MKARLAIIGAVTALTFLATVAIAPAAPRAGALLAAAPSARAASSHCPAGTPAGSTCVTIPAHCPAETTCPEVIAQPTTGLAQNQSVFLTMDNFWSSTDKIYLQYCQDVAPLKSSPPLCVRTAISELPNPQVVLEPFPSTGSVSYSFQVLQVVAGSTRLQGVVPGEDKFGSFFCDTKDPCSIDVTDPYLGPHGSASAITPSPVNTAVIPISFAKPDAGCKNATFLTSESEYGIDPLLAQVASFTCSGKNPVADTNVDVDAPSAVSSFVQGNFPVVFTDSPSDPAQQQLLASIKGQYAFIPVALSANVIGFQAIAQGQQGYPDSSFKLTPNMVAGLITDYYTASYSSDIGDCAWRRASNRECALISTLNPVPGFEAPLAYGSYVRGDSSTPTYATFQYACETPRVPIKIGHHEVTEPQTAAQVFDYAYTLNGLKPPHGCPATIDTFPTFTKDVPNFSTSGTPATQLTKLESFVPLPQDSTQTPRAGFSDMSWPDSRTWGLNVAALQNAAGQFVLPSTPSLTAAAAHLRLTAQGYYAYNYANPDPKAYPMPDVWYALVSTKAQPAAMVGAERTLLDDILTVSGGSLAKDLPPGYAPLPANLEKVALAEVDKDITSAGPPVTTTTTVPPTTVPSTTVPATSVPTTTVPTTTVTTEPARSHPHPIKLPTQLASFTIVGRSGSWLPAVFACVLSAAILFGPGLLLFARRRRRS